jgi:hypothetical protein
VQEHSLKTASSGEKAGRLDADTEARGIILRRNRKAPAETLD